MSLILKLSQSKNSIFTFDELQNIFSISNKQVFKNKLNYLVKSSILERITKGIYSLKGKQINKFELTNKIFSKSYISFFTALYYHSIIFQYENDIYLAYKKSDIRKMLDFDIKLKCLKKEILLNPSGIISNGFYSIASAERAFLDTVYLYGDIHFDNLKALDYKKIIELLEVYKSKTLEKKVKSYFIKK